METQKNEQMRVQQISKEYPVSVATIWRWAKMGKITAIKVSEGVTCFKRSELEALFSGMK